MGTRNKFIIILLMIVLLLGGAVYYFHDKVQDMEVKIAITEQNAEALKDSLHVTKNKVGSLEYSKAVLVVERDQLKEMNGILDTEVKKEKHKVSAMASTILVLKGEIAELENSTEYIPPTGTETDTTYKINWSSFKEYDAVNSRLISGHTTFGLDRETFKLTDVKSFLTKDDIKMKLVQGLRERNGVVEIFARSEYPGFGVDDMHVTIIDPRTHPVLSKFTNTKPKVFGLSLYVGYGMTYNFRTTSALDGVQIGGGFYWRPNLF